jgi:ribosomal protein S18 acetylase RimI-like enzyme
MADQSVKDRSSLDRRITLRQAEEDDEAFLLEVYSSTRIEELALTNWNDAQKKAFLGMQFAAQQNFYREQNPDASHLIILIEDRPVGRIYTSNRPGEIRILDITVLPEHRNQGIGAYIVESVMDQGEKNDKPVTIHVESFNPSLRLFERLGFRCVQINGIHHLMKWQSG